MTTTTHLAFYPRDGFFCKDGRGWYGDSAGAGSALDWPWPSTIRGVVRTLWGREHEAAIARHGWPTATGAVTLGAMLAMWRSRATAQLERRWPVPCDVEYVENLERSDSAPSDARVLSPAPRHDAIATLGRDDDPARERLWIATAEHRRKPGTRARWWSEAELVAWIAGSQAPDQQTQSREPQRRRVTRVAIDPNTRTGVDGELFSYEVIETVERDGEWVIAAAVSAPDDVFGSIATVGSDRRLARVDRIDRSSFAAPPELAAATVVGAAGLRLLIVTPTIFERGWLPDGLVTQGDEYRGHLAGLSPEVVLRAAMVGRPSPISGWDMATKTPRRTDLAVTPGAVYFFQRTDGLGFSSDDIGGLWLGALGRRQDDGFGRIVAAPWHPAS